MSGANLTSTTLPPSNVPGCRWRPSGCGALAAVDRSAGRTRYVVCTGGAWTSSGLTWLCVEAQHRVFRNTFNALQLFMYCTGTPPIACLVARRSTKRTRMERHLSGTPRSSGTALCALGWSRRQQPQRSSPQMCYLRCSAPLLKLEMPACCRCPPPAPHHRGTVRSTASLGYSQMETLLSTAATSAVAAS